jgi:hypothetical protein
MIFFIYYIVYSYVTLPEEKSQEKQVWGGKYVIKKISHVLWCDMIFIQLFVCFLYPLAKALHYKPWDRDPIQYI